MTPKITKAQAERAKKAGATVTKPAQRPPTTPIPQPAAVPDMSAVERVAEAVQAQAEKTEKVASQAAEAASQQSQEMSRLIATLGMPTEPVRLRVHRDMEMSSPTYLLIQYIDVIPIEPVARKLNS